MVPCCLRVLRWGVSVVVAAVVLAWFAGELLTDMYAWSQWLWWIPSLVAAIAAAMGALATVSIDRLRRRKNCADVEQSPIGTRPAVAPAALWTVAIVLTGHWATLEHALWRSRGEPGDNDLRIVHWNMTKQEIGSDEDPYVRELLELSGDVTILTDAWVARGHPDVQQWADEREASILHMGPFTLLSVVPLDSVRWILARDGMYVARFLLDTHESLGRPVVVYAVDLPSAPDLARHEITSTVREAIDTAEDLPPDLVIGDMNITRRSVSLQTMFPGYDHAYDLAGGRYAASFPQRWPIVHIDHALVGPGLDVSRYELTDPGASRHLAQQIWISPAGQQAAGSID